MEPVTALVAAISALGNVALAFWGLFQRAKKRKASEQLDTVTEGLGIIEQAIKDNKGLIEKTDVGRKITGTIKTYGTVATEAVDAARKIVRYGP